MPDVYDCPRQAMPRKVLRKQLAKLIAAPATYGRWSISTANCFDCRLVANSDAVLMRLFVFRGRGGLDDDDSTVGTALVVFLAAMSFDTPLRQRTYRYLIQQENPAEAARSATLVRDLQAIDKVIQHKIALRENSDEALYFNRDKIYGPEISKWIGGEHAKHVFGNDLSSVVADWLPAPTVIPVRFKPVPSDDDDLEPGVIALPGWSAHDPAETIVEIREMKLNVADFRHVFQGPNGRAADDAVQQVREVLDLAKIDAMAKTCDLQPIGVNRMTGPASIRLGPFDPQKSVVVLRCKPKPGLGGYAFNLRFTPSDRVKEIYDTLKQLIHPNDEPEAVEMPEVEPTGRPAADKAAETPAATPAKSVAEQVKDALEIVALYKTEVEAISEKRRARDELINSNTALEATLGEGIRALTKQIEERRTELEKHQRTGGHALRTIEGEIAAMEQAMADDKEYQQAVKLVEHVRSLLHDQTR